LKNHTEFSTSIVNDNMNWDQYAMSIAEAVAQKSKDPWHKVGAVILREDNSIASVG
jgi:deoxycytidylate deaminase